MSAQATNLALSEELVDLNEASSNQLQSLLPGIGNVLASRIVAYREEHGPFESALDLSKVDGYRGKTPLQVGAAPLGRALRAFLRLLAAQRCADLAVLGAVRLPRAAARFERRQRVSLGAQHRADVFVRLRATPTVSVGVQRRKRFLRRRRSAALTRSPRSRIPAFAGKVNQDKPSEVAETVHESLRHESLRLNDPLAVQEIETANGEVIPLHRPWRAWGIAAGIALFSAAVGSIYGIRSQEGGPRAGLERQVVRTQDQVADLKGSVKVLENQSEAFASSINALDARISTQEQARPAPGKRQERSRTNATTEARPPATTPAKGTEVRESVRQALRSFDTYLEDQPVQRTGR